MEDKNLFQKGYQFSSEYIKWQTKGGGRYRTKQEIEQIYQVCSSNECGNFKTEKNYGSCGLCGCRLTPHAEVINKIAWNTTQCPAEAPYWGPDGVIIKPETSESQQIKNAPEAQTEAPSAGEKKGGCGCGK